MVTPTIEEMRNKAEREAVIRMLEKLTARFADLHLEVRKIEVRLDDMDRLVKNMDRLLVKREG